MLKHTTNSSEFIAHPINDKNVVALLVTLLVYIHCLQISRPFHRTGILNMFIGVPLPGGAPIVFVGIA